MIWDDDDYTRLHTHQMLWSESRTIATPASAGISRVVRPVRAYTQRSERGLDRLRIPRARR